jgi:hypothetical protein
MKCTLSIVVSLFLFICCKKREAPNPLVIYNEALQQLFKEKYYKLFVDPADDTVNIDSLFLGGHIDREEYNEFVFELRDKGILSGKTQHVDYINTLLPEFRDIETLAFYLKDPFIEENFESDSIKKIANTLYSTANINASGFKNKLVQVTDYKEAEKKMVLLNDKPVISFSKIAFDESATHAIIYFQYFCGIKCGNGWLLYLERKWNHWEIVEYRPMWDI